MKTSLQELLRELPEPVISHIQHLERMRQDFVANVSHELRTPLTVIHGYLETLMAQPENRHLGKIFMQMFQQTLRMQNLIADLLLLSAMEIDEQNATVKHPVHVSGLLELITEEARILSANKHRIVLESDDDLCLQGNENELRSLFSNIIFNAVKYTPAGENIHISWQKQKKNAIFKVVDTGIGIAKEHIPRITERFYRVDKARSRESGGTGLGLAIAKHVLIRHDGQLKIKSQVGKGSTFSCIFPV
jgi:two-component system, OmpR family, phosphate regulon sensor histidine kinase PhoR